MLQYFQSETYDLDALMFRHNNVTLALNNVTYCGDHSFYFAFKSDSDAGLNFDNVVSINEKTLEIAPSLERYWY